MMTYARTQSTAFEMSSNETDFRKVENVDDTTHLSIMRSSDTCRKIQQMYELVWVNRVNPSGVMNEDRDTRGEMYAETGR